MYRLFGGTVSLNYLACLLRESGYSVELYQPKFKIPDARPLRLNLASHEDLQGFFKRHGPSPRNFTGGPSIENPNLLSRFWEPAARLCHRGQLERVLVEKFVEMGGDLRVSEKLPPPLEAPGLIQIIDLERREVPHWDSAHFVEGGSAKIHALYYALKIPSGKHLLAQSRVVEGSIGFLEPVSADSAVLSLYSRSRYSMERALCALHSSKSAAAPLAWKALLAMNAGAAFSSEIIGVGLQEIDVGFALRLGKSFGRASPLPNLSDDYSFRQLRRLRDLLSAGEAPTRDQLNRWNSSEARRFIRHFRELQRQERGLKHPEKARLLRQVAHLFPRVFARSPR